jgi:hypothetical protein
MSKKDNLRFKKRIKSQILEELSHAEERKSPSPTEQKKVIDTPAIALKPADRPKENVLPPNQVDNNLKLIKVDLKKSAYIIGSMLVLIVAIYFTDQKTDFLLKAGSSIFKFLHISA